MFVLYNSGQNSDFSTKEEESSIYMEIYSNLLDLNF